MNDKYPPPQVPEGFTYVKCEIIPCPFWVVQNPKGTGLLWLDCTDTPRYYVPAIQDSAIQAESYEQAKAHIEALLFLGEVK